MQGAVPEFIRSCKAVNKALAVSSLLDTDDGISSASVVISALLEYEAPEDIPRHLCLPFAPERILTAGEREMAADHLVCGLDVEVSRDALGDVECVDALPDLAEIRRAVLAEAGDKRSADTFGFKQEHDLFTRYLSYSSGRPVGDEFCAPYSARLIFWKLLEARESEDQGLERLLVESVSHRVRDEMLRARRGYRAERERVLKASGREICLMIPPQALRRINPVIPEGTWICMEASHYGPGRWCACSEERLEEAVRGRLVWPPYPGMDAMPPRASSEVRCLGLASTLRTESLVRLS